MVNKLGLILSWNFEGKNCDVEAGYIDKILKHWNVDIVRRYINDEKTKDKVLQILNEIPTKDYDLIILFISSHGYTNEDGQFCVQVDSDNDEEIVVPFNEYFLEPLKKHDANIWFFLQVCRGEKMSKALSTSSYSLSRPLSSLSQRDLECFHPSNSKPLPIEIKGIQKNVFILSPCDEYATVSHRRLGGCIFYSMYRCIEQQLYGKIISIEKFALLVNLYLSQYQLNLPENNTQTIPDPNPNTPKTINQNLQTQYYSTLGINETVDLDINISQVTISVIADNNYEDSYPSIGVIVKNDRKENELGIFVQQVNESIIAFIGCKDAFRNASNTLTVEEFKTCQICVLSNLKKSPSEAKFTIRRSIHDCPFKFEYIEFDEVSSLKLQTDFGVVPVVLDDDDDEFYFHQPIFAQAPQKVDGLIKEIKPKYFEYQSCEAKRGAPIFNEKNNLIAIHYEVIGINNKAIKISTLQQHIKNFLLITNL